MPTTHDFHFRSDYWADASARAAFKDFIRQVFGINLDPWDAAGYWDDDSMLFSTQEALPFYRSQGFMPTAEHTPVLRLLDGHPRATSAHLPISEIRALDPAQLADRALSGNHLHLRPVAGGTPALPVKAPRRLPIRDHPR